MKYFFTLVFLFCSFFLKAQDISGRVIDVHSGESIVGATIILVNSNEGTITDASGNFSLRGDGPIEVSFIGYKPQRINPDGKFLVVKLVPNVRELQAVEVIGRMDRVYNSEYSFAATRTASPNKAVPQSISTVTKELIADRQAFQLAEAVKIASGVIPTGYYNHFAIRGITQNEEGSIINGMRTRQYFFNQPLTANIERIEVLKGPASATFSSVDPGGSINLVTKKPLPIERKEVSMSVGSFSTMRSTADFTGPLNESKTLLYRVNGAYQEARSFRDIQSQKALLISPSFSYIPDDRTAINAEFIFSNFNGKLDRGQPIFGAVAGVTNLNSTPKSFNLGSTNDYLKSKEVIIMGNFSRKFTESISFNTAYMKQTWSEDLFEHRTTNAFGVDLLNNPVPTLAAMQAVQRQQFWNIDNLNSYFNFDFNTGAVKNKLLVGYDLHSWHKLKGGGQNAARGFLLKDGTTARTFVPANADAYQTIIVNGNEMPRPNVDHFDLTDPTYTIRNINDYVFAKVALPAALTTTNAIYIQEQLSWNRFILLMSLRNEWFKDITHYQSENEIVVQKNALLPRVGLTFAVNKNINVYGTYLEGYQPQSNTVTLIPIAAPEGSTFDPLVSDLKEMGVKATLLNGRLQINSAIYELNQGNLLMNANDPDNPDLLVTRGAERSRGFEIDLAGFILPNWQVNASYSYIDAVIMNDRDASLIGARKQNTPINSANFWSRYNFANDGYLGDLGIGLGIQHNGSRIPWFTRDFEVPAYTLLDLALYYTPNNSNLQLAFNVNNVTNTEHWLGAQTYLRLFPGAPRNMILTATYKF